MLIFVRFLWLIKKYVFVFQFYEKFSHACLVKVSFVSHHLIIPTSNENFTSYILLPYRYSYEAYEGYDSIDSPKAIVALKYMLLMKIMLNL